ncbi:hypothetical protein ACQVUB_25990 [Bacillus mycoides]|uniref:hypothetical protein n=1 Tax=Bacillus mycoides TaxID=1405 RepID=UPI003D658623
MKKYKKLAIAMPLAGILATGVFGGPTLSFADTTSQNKVESTDVDKMRRMADLYATNKSIFDKANELHKKANDGSFSRKVNQLLIEEANKLFGKVFSILSEEERSLLIEEANTLYMKAVDGDLDSEGNLSFYLRNDGSITIYSKKALEKYTRLEVFVNGEKISSLGGYDKGEGVHDLTFSSKVTKITSEDIMIPNNKIEIKANGKTLEKQ